MYFFDIFISFLNLPREWLQNFALTIAFSIGSNSVLRVDQCNNLHQWLASVLLTFFWFRLKFCYGQEKQLIFVQVFLKLNKVRQYRLQFLCLQILSFWNYLSRSSGIKNEKWLKHVKCGALTWNSLHFPTQKMFLWILRLEFLISDFDFAHIWKQ